MVTCDIYYTPVLTIARHIRTSIATGSKSTKHATLLLCFTPGILTVTYIKQYARGSYASRAVNPHTFTHLHTLQAACHSPVGDQNPDYQSEAYELKCSCKKLDKGSEAQRRRQSHKHEIRQPFLLLTILNVPFPGRPSPPATLKRTAENDTGSKQASTAAARQSRWHRRIRGSSATVSPSLICWLLDATTSPFPLPAFSSVGFQPSGPGCDHGSSRYVGRVLFVLGSMSSILLLFSLAGQAWPHVILHATVTSA